MSDGLPQSNGSSTPTADEGFRRTDPSEVVTPDDAIVALNDALNLLKTASNPNEPWQDARHILDATGDALDAGGLALKALGDDDNDGGGGDDDGDNEKLGEVQWLSLMVSAARARLLGRAYIDAKVKNPPPLPPAGRKRSPLVVWASQTGTAESFAQSLANKLAKMREGNGGASNVDIVDMKDAALKDVVERKRVYFVVSTFGLGRPPRKAEAFYANLQLYRAGGTQEGGSASDGGVVSSSPLAGVEVAVAALGDSRFNEFAAFGINLAQEIQGLGARPVLKVTTVDGKKGKADQKEQFREWEDLILKLETARAANDAQAGAAGGIQQQQSEASCCVIC